MIDFNIIGNTSSFYNTPISIPHFIGSLLDITSEQGDFEAPIYSINISLIQGWRTVYISGITEWVLKNWCASCYFNFFIGMMIHFTGDIETYESTASFVNTASPLP